LTFEAHVGTIRVTYHPAFTREYFMTVVDRQRAFEQALQHDDAALLLATLLQLIVAVEQALHWQLKKLQIIEPTDNPEFYSDAIRHLLLLDMLAYVSVSADPETRALRHLLDSEDSAPIIAWYQHQWSARVITTTDIIGSIASALRTAMTVIYGHIHLLRVYTKPDALHETAYQQIIMAVDTLRACRNQLRTRLAANGVAMQLY
jgi:hypothetical protein